MAPINEPNSATLPRTPTLEAQKEPSTTTRLEKWAKAVIALRETTTTGDLKKWTKATLGDTPDDTTEQQLKDAIPKSKGDDRRLLKGLLSAYSFFKNNAGHGIVQDLFQCFTITNGSQDGVQKSKTPYLDLDVSILKHWTKAKSKSCS